MFVVKGVIKMNQFKLIQAENGAIILDAQFGDVVIRGRNVRIEATAEDGEVTINSPKHVYLKAQ